MAKKGRTDNQGILRQGTEQTAFLEFDEREVLQNSGKISAKLVQTHAESEFEKYRIVQDRLFESDFDKAVKKLATDEPNTREDE